MNIESFVSDERFPLVYKRYIAGGLLLLDTIIGISTITNSSISIPFFVLNGYFLFDYLNKTRHTPENFETAGDLIAFLNKKVKKQVKQQ